ncbi:hypothetical protein GCM10011533_22490 [Streptosporangium jomthongense]|uniref:Integrase n=1 Tax=Marinobacter aromaticivorans TaxID=1494078 RepID=A0ABW2IVN0_9GAMM|nr:hypothetical protein [Marinobacter aromaticivorans]GGE69660.1 hypothetical protein GCM10011533_22490 [Streptosporangium jomthongense]
MTQSAVFFKTLDSCEAQARLDALPGSNNNCFGSMTWQFEGQRGASFTIDFNDMLGMSDRYPDWPLAHKVDWVVLTKRIWLILASMTTPSQYVPRVSGLKLFWAAMAHHNLTQLTRDNCVLVLEFLLMHVWRQGGVSENLSIKSSGSFSAQTPFKAWRVALASLGLDWFARSLTDSFINKQLKTLIPALTDDELTSKDWYEGGSYDLLTLDHGRYYVEHCLTFFEKQYPLAMALASTFRATPVLAASCSYKQGTVTQFINLCLQGYTVEEICCLSSSYSATTVRNVHREVTHYFKAAYRQARLEAALLQDETITSFVSACGLQPSSENTDRMRVILWDWMRRKDKTETLRLLSEGQEVPWDVFKKQLSVVKKHFSQQPCPMPSGEDYRAIGLIKGGVKDPHGTYPRQLISLVAKAGITSMAALTGWRRSEFGFPRSAIKRTRNDDKLDQYAFPWRYQVNWYVYKTGGDVRELREISFSTFLIAEKMQALVGATDEQPCLYAVHKKNNNPSNSYEQVGSGVRALWGHFVNHYSGFKQLDDWTSWQLLQEVRDSGKPFTAAEKQEYERLVEQLSAEEWSNFSIDANLKEAWRRSRDEWPRLSLFLTQASTKDKRDWLIHYCDGALRSDWKDLLDAHLPENTKEWIQSLPKNVLRARETSRTVMNDLIEGTLYPSPHAFRHMWAEAVYRRFDGDAGWMIRSQFKHISRSMWLAYIRDKDNRFGHERAKAQVISSLVHNYLRHQGEGYAGQLHTWLRRLFKKTAVLSPEEQEKIAHHLATVEIENIKSNPWGYCLLKRRTRSKAKCAVMGEPMRHNASPDLCLGCIHNLMQAENVEWALFHAATHVMALRNPIVPAIFKASSYDLVQNVTRHVCTLNPKHEALSELQEVLDDYRASRAA